MNIKDLLVVGGFALLTTWALDRFVFSRFRPQEPTEQVAGQMFSAPTSNRVVKPLNREIDFVDTKRSAPEVITEIETDWALLTFSSDGAALERLEFKRGTGGVEENIITIFPAVERQHKAFLVALDERTPYYFKLVDNRQSDDAFNVIYEGAFGDGVLRKTFKIHKTLFKIELLNEVMYHNSDQKGMLRTYIPSPIMPGVQQDRISGIVSNPSGSVEKITHDKVNLANGWWTPSLFGTENRYVIHAMTASSGSCIERAYYDSLPEGRITAILESQEIIGSGACAFTVFTGPKDEEAVAGVDERLEQTFEHSGILAPISRALLKLLNFIYRYVHNYGIAIIILTILMRLVMLPFSLRAERGIKKSAELSDRMEHLKKKYKHDPERMRIEQAELIKKYGMPQLLMLVPMFIQLPVFIALNRVLSSSIELYHAPFFGWIHDLSAPDPYYILPLCIALSMLINALMTEPKKRGMLLMLALVFGAFSINFSSGLVIFIIASTVTGIVQTYLQKHLKVV